MSETAVKSNQREAARLFERGVAAARGGQRRVAAGLLSRAVQCDPRHEQAWLWLSGVLEDPSEIAFCLRSVLSINPYNERAQQGLAWLEQRALIPGQANGSDAGVAAEEEAAPEHHERELWWVRWRQNRRETSRAWQLVWAVCILLLLSTLALNVSLRNAIEHNAELARAASRPPADPLTITQVRVPPEPILLARPAPVEDAQALAYLSAVDETRAQLRQAVDGYRSATSQPGGSSLLHAAAARRLRDQIDVARDVFAKAAPPPSLEQAHNDYLAGLSGERAALDDMLEFYGSFSIQLANRATLRMEDASRALERARSAFAVRQQQAVATGAWFAQTAR